MKYTVFFVLIIATTFLRAQQKDMSIIDFLNIPGLSSPQIAPDGSDLLYVFSESDWEANKQVGHIWRSGMDGSDPRQITFGSAGEGNPRWSPDSRHIAFTTKRGDDEHTQIYLMRSDGGEGRRLTDHKTAVSSPAWSVDGSMIYFLATDTLSKAEKEARKVKDDVYALDENYEQRHLWSVNVEDGQETQITQGDYSIMSFDLSGDGRKIVVHRGPNPLFDFYRLSELWVMDTDGANPVQLTSNGVGESGARLSPDGGQALFVAFANENFDFYYNDKLFIVPTDASSPAQIAIKDIPYEVFSADWSADGNSIFLTTNMGSQIQLWQYHLNTGNLKQLTEGKHSVSQWSYQPATGQHVMALNQISNPGDLFEWSETGPQQITHHFDFLAEDYHLPSQQVISWKGEDGVTVEGILYLPHDYQQGTRYPLVVQTHGGPASSDRYGLSRSFTRYNPVLTANGYVVLQPNYRGSTGYGDDFLRDMVGGYFRQSHLDVMAGVDHLIEQGIADPDRMVKMGWSAGGHMTNKIITYTDRFKAASSGAGAVNWIDMYAQSDVRTYRTPWFGGSPWEENAPIDVYWNNSPLKDISKVTTPTLVIVGENDPRVPLPQSVELYRALRSNGVPTHLYVAPREPHGWQELRHRLYKINVELDWFAKYALGQEYEWEKAP